ncbi:hypothetical protein ABG768_009011 [Culter alburnus]|uniref:UPAR/Ly6 domain-containing protein n=1 Tax=Culter alburnus TaxID=194366 RepID=A0AAW1ZM78_CULAL
MALSVLCILMSTLFYKVNALTCYQCIPETSTKCTETKVECPVGQCGTMKTTSYTGNNKLADMVMKNCSVARQCGTASVNFGITQIFINNQCCGTNLCNNNQSEPEPPKSIPNGMDCYTCNGEDCSSALPCANDEDHCIKATVNTDGQTLIMKGCATISFCRGDLSTQIGQSSSSSVDLNCCEGHLCNGAQSVTPSRWFQLGLLMYAIIQMTF